ncbi:MAG: S8 family serine peptidase [Gemmatimonadota bacterium]|nr:S8 family serine peptidase [Gemmatimonadota bacterium]MDE2986413.1 S8 family serine peptidase [Gemmatimonadota bacterium]
MTPENPHEPGPRGLPPERICIQGSTLRDLRGRGVQVAVIDSGVNPGHPHVSGVAGGVRIDLSGRVSEDWVDRLGHGTAVFAAIQEKAPEAEIYAVRVFDDRLRTSVRALVAAIDWASERGIQAVNLSLGTVREEHAGMLEEAVGRLAEAGGVVVAAAEADGRRWWPGSLPGAVGVVVDEDLPRDCVEVRDGVVAASPYPRPIPGVPVERNLNGISFAVANVTGVLARGVEGGGGVLERCATNRRLSGDG